MDEQVPTSMLIAMGTAMLLSLASLYYLFQKHIDGRPLLSYEPRQRVPWGVGVALLAIAMPLANVVYFLVNQPEVAAEIAQPTIETQVASSWGTFAFMLAFVFGVGAWIATFYQTDPSDLGMPTSYAQAMQDIGIGCLATVGSLLPIYAVQLFLVNAFQEKTKHPLVQQLEANPSPAMIAVGIAMAVIAAPLFEEFIFRCLLQGWLERCEDKLTGYSGTERGPRRDQLVQKGLVEADYQMVRQELLYQRASESYDTPPPPRPAHGLLPALPHGWTPILISGILFGLAHLGHGVAPVSLILFGIVLAYLYQRTHRLLPSITAHMVFNGYSMLLLWLNLNAPAG